MAPHEAPRAPADQPKKVAVIGMDCAIPHLVERHIAEGYLPNFKRLIDNGTIADNCLVPFPTITPPNWATIATGAWPGTHQITDFYVHVPGKTPDNTSAVQAFSSERWKAEPIWDAADKAGKKCIILNYPGSWPSKMKNGIVVGGAGMAPIESRDGLRGHEPFTSICLQQLITTGLYPGAIRGSFSPVLPGKEWANAAPMGEEPLEMEVELALPGAKAKPARTVWYVLARQSGANANEGYDRVTLSPSRDLGEAFFTIGPGEWSKNVVTTFKMADGTEREGWFRAKLIEIAEDASEFRLFLTSIGETSGWSDPPEVAKELISEEGAFTAGGGLRVYADGWFDADTYVEISEQASRWLGDAASKLLGNHEWDLFFMHSHAPDWFYHAFLTEMDPATCTDERHRHEAWDVHRRVYETQDRMLGQILAVLGDDTLVVLVSDHGAVADGPTLDPYKILVPAGLSVLKDERDAVFGRTSKSHVDQELAVRAMKPDPAKSRAMAQRVVYIYVNLKGRDPEGIVEPEDYEKVQQAIIDAMYAYVDPATGKRPVSLALAKKDARLLGLYGEGIGDVVYALYPWFGSQHGQILPTEKHGIGDLKGLLCFTGPGIKKGHRLARTVGLQDIVPTICYLMDLPVPETVDGGVIYQALEDPSLKTTEIRRLRDGLARLEGQLSAKN